MHHHRRRPPIEGGERMRRDLPLAEHPFLDLETDFALVLVGPTTGAPHVELVGEAPLPELVVEGENGTTRIRASGMGRGFDERLRRGRFWEGSFWDRRRWKKHFQVQLVMHVPKDLRARFRPSAAYVHVERLSGCELDIHADAGALALEDVSGRLVLATEAGRIDGTGLSGSISASTSAGAIRLEILDLEPGRHKVRTSMGAAIIELARGLPVQIDTRTAMGSSRVDAVSTRGASAVLDIEAELGAIRVMASRHEWAQPLETRSASAPGGRTPYRSPAGTPSSPDDEAVEKILARVADGSLSPGDARELLHSMGWT
jgi:hypothetical protein